jgi:very-short-patch-repair endonuclease
MSSQSSRREAPVRDRTVLGDALAQLRLKLLDLSGRNRLLNFRHTPGRSLQFVEGNPSALFQRLVDAPNRAAVTINGLPEPPRDEWIEQNGRRVRPDPREWARQLGISTSYDLSSSGGNTATPNVRTLLYPDDLARHCRKIEREALSAIEETGANMLFLVLGFLEFPDQRSSDRTLCAPLISLPVVMSKRDLGGHQTFSLQYSGDDITENLSLREKVREDHSVILPELDDEQINIDDYFAALHGVIRPHPGFVIRRWASLCLLSFTNMLLVRDLDPSKWPISGHWNGLLDHPIVRQVFEGRAEDADTSINSAPEYELEESPATHIPLVFDADSSQHSALVDVIVHRKNLVIEGPPGTGKSQTITNLIAAGIAAGKTILFVAEKLAALEVVKTRLSLAGLDPFVLELHSNKSNKKRVLEDISKRLEYRASQSPDLPRKAEQLADYRAELRSYCNLVNSVSHNAFGLTIHQVMWRAETERAQLTADDRLIAQLSVPDAAEISSLELSRRTDCLSHLGAQYARIGGFEKGSAFWGFFPDKMIPGDEFQLGEIFGASAEWADQFVDDVVYYTSQVDGEVVGLSAEFARTQLRSLQRLLEASQDLQCLHLVPRLFARERTGDKPSRTLDTLAGQIDRFGELSRLARQGLRTSRPPTPNHLQTLRQLDQVTSQLGAALGTMEQIHDLCAGLRRECDRLSVALSSIEGFCAAAGIPFDGSRRTLNQLVQIERLITEAPEAVIELQHAGLMRPGCHAALADLAAIQREWIALHAELDQHLYLDMLPTPDTIRQAVVVLRNDRGWRGVFSASWRSAVTTHRRLHRTKERLPTSERLVQLEKLTALVQLRERWQASPAWQKYLGFPAPADPPALDDYVALAKWNQAADVLLTMLAIPSLSLAHLTSDRLRQLKRQFGDIGPAIRNAVVAVDTICALLPRIADVRGNQTLARLLQVSTSLVAVLEAQLDWLKAEMPTGISFATCVAACEAAIEQQQLKNAIDNNQDAIDLLGDHFIGTDTDMTAAFAALKFGQSIDSFTLSHAVRVRLKSEPPAEAARILSAALERVSSGFARIGRLKVVLDAYGSFDPEAWAGRSAEDGIIAFAGAFRDKLKVAVDAVGHLVYWSQYVMRRREAVELGLIAFVELLEAQRLAADELSAAYSYSTYATIVRNVFRAVPLMGRFSGVRHNQIREEYGRLDREVISIRGRAIAAQCTHKAYPPSGRNGARVDDKTEMVLLNYLLPQQRPRVPVRKMLLRAGRAVQALKPCFMMGPQAVAQYLTPGAVAFDLVIMDEASQLKPEEAIGAIARGGQLVVVGDSKQLPPTSFFSRVGQAGDGDVQFATTDAESILDICSSHFHPPRPLRWHYRSRHHSLIAFSNQQFYRGNLIVFPSPYGQSSRLGVRASYLPDAVYDNQTNLREAERVVDAVAEHLSSRADESLGVVTLNIKQRDLIAELLEERLRHLPDADDYREQWAREGQPLFVKNLENVQGDERDAIIISTTFGKPPGSGSVRQNFGPISRQGGWRRLNVLFTRARRSVALYTSLRPEDIVVDGSTPEGTKALRNYLEYARSGSLAVPVDDGREPDSDFEVAVISRLQSRGYEVTPQLGVAGFRIDIAVRHPDAPGTYLAAIECDGASYHSAQSVRDRDRIRQEILESLGWRGRIWRVWSTDWFRAPRQEAEKLFGFLEGIRTSWRPEHLSGESWIEERRAASPLEETVDEAAAEPSVVNDVLLETGDDQEVQVGDLVKYADIENPSDVLRVRLESYEERASRRVSSMTEAA